MTGITEQAKRLGLHDCNLHQIFDRVEELQYELAASGDREIAYIAEIKGMDNELTESRANDLFAMKLLAESQAREKVLRDALFELANLHVVVYSQSPEGRAYMKKLGDLMASSDDTALKAALKAERERYKKVFHKMRNVAAGYSNHCEDNGSTRRLEREFTEAEEMFRSIGV